jgi:hypothetical protein
MGLHVGLEVVAPSEELATSFEVTLEVRILFGSKLSGVSRTCYCAWAASLAQGSTRLPPLLTFRAPAVWWEG